MSGASFLQFAALIVLLVATVPFLGRYLAAVYGERPDGSAPGDRWFRPVERLIYRAAGVDETREQRWTTYAMSLLAFSVASVLVLYLLLRVQDWLPFNPTGMSNVDPTTAFNTAVSFMTNTNWQVYAGES